MNRGHLSLFVAALLVVFLGMAVTRASEPLKGAQVQNLLHEQLAQEFTPDREILIDLVDIPPHTTLPRHRHPGEEFHYYMEGEVEISIDGEEPIMGTPGKTGHVPYNRWHTASTNDKGAKVLVFRVHNKDEPMRYLESEDKSDSSDSVPGTD